ncbi:MAG: hypothetical protein HN509_04140 [Halobacteriovoraceae bacterium]|mgnify:CR=1 FL=1|jgi:membrane-bound lytic murein transglycosylase A|nr:hypothetical protein [Halobacteriovoraceae bacterium]
MKILTLSIVFGLLLSCSRNYSTASKGASKIITPEKVQNKIQDMDLPGRLSDNWPILTDDLDYSGLRLAIDRQIKAFVRRPLLGKLSIGGDTFPLNHIEKSLLRFSSLLKELETCLKINFSCRESFELSLKSEFNIYDIGGEEKAHFTAYYSPTFEAKKEPSPEFNTAIYQYPSSRELRAKTRNQIIFDGALEGHGLELFWIKDPFDLYLLQVEGGGRVQLSGESEFHFISYAGTNKKAHRFISRYMRERGYINDSSVKSQRAFLKDNPDTWREIYNYNPNYVFFSETKSEPLGLEDIPLTENRSMAQDRSIYVRKGLLSFVVAKRPIQTGNGEIELRPYSRFYIDQDTGGAIRGQARADLYFGFGKSAELAANHLNLKGQLYFLLLKK